MEAWNVRVLAITTTPEAIHPLANEPGVAELAVETTLSQDSLDSASDDGRSCC
jgi:hypothetical protein